MKNLILVLLALGDNSFLNEPNKCVIKKLHKTLLFIREPFQDGPAHPSEKDTPFQRTENLKIDRVKIKYKRGRSETEGEGWGLGPGDGGDEEGEGKEAGRAESALPSGRTPPPFQIDSQSPQVVSSETWLKEASICAVSSIQWRANGPSKINMQTCPL